VKTASTYNLSSACPTPRAPFNLQAKLREELTLRCPRQKKIELYKPILVIGVNLLK
jgi:hypothetical protein